MAQSSSPLAVIDEKSLEQSWTVIGAGGFGQVFKARHQQWRRDVAIKLLCLDPGSFSDKDLLREAELMRRAESPYVMRVLGMFRGSMSFPFRHVGLVMELMERGSLDSLQNKLKQLPPWSLVFRLAHQVALGMNYLHSLSPPIIHRDLKPGNVLLDTGLNVKITDFGLAKFVTNVTSTCLKGAGTPFFMPPEAFSPSYTSAFSFDVYSYAILLWTLLNTGHSIAGFDPCRRERPPLGVVKGLKAPGLAELVNLMERSWHQTPQRRPTFTECTAVTEGLYEKHKHGIIDAVYRVQKKLDADGRLKDEPRVQQMRVLETKFKTLKTPSANQWTDFGTSTSSGGLFGNTNTTSNPFGGGATASLFRGSGFTAAQQQPGTTLKFKPPTGSDTMVKGGVTTSINTQHQCITAMYEYENKSLEELRLEDYQAGRQRPSNPLGAAVATGGLFGAPAAPAAPASRATGLFGATATANTGFSFGQNKSSFGTTPPPAVTPVEASPVEASRPRRNAFLKYASPLSLDPNTACSWLILSEDNKKVTWTRQDQGYPEHAERFTFYCSVLSRESLSGRSYFEVEWSGEGVNIAVGYKDINRKEKPLSAFGLNDKSWMLACWGPDGAGAKRYEFGHNSIGTAVSGPAPSTGRNRWGVFVDPLEGILSFYGVDVGRNKMSLLHTERTTFKRPLYAGIRAFEATAEVCKIW